MTGPDLPSWREGPTRSAVVDFLASADEIPPAERVAVFDNDGTMWCEKPNYPQLDFFVHELEHAVTASPNLGDREEFRALLEHDLGALQGLGLEAIASALLDLFIELTPAQFDAKVGAFFSDQLHPDRGVPYRQLRYQPMLELIEALRFHGFDVYLATAGGAEFVRVISQDFYGVPPEGVVGSQIDYDITRDDDARLRLVRTNRIVASGANEGPAKVPNIQRILGRRPVVAGGNSAGDAEMLEYATTYDGPSLAVLVDHDDDVREYAYESKAGTFESDQTILESADQQGWTVVSMKRDWATVFVDDRRQ